jgi:hypothetical protein
MRYISSAMGNEPAAAPYGAPTRGVEARTAPVGREAALG